MKKIWTIIPALLLAAACSDDENGYSEPPTLSDADSEITIPAIPAYWAPGMAYKPYSDELPVAPGVPVNLLVVGDDERAAQELAVAANEAWIWDFVQYGRPVMLDVNVRSCYFPNHTDIHTAQTGNETSFNPEHKACDVVVAGFETTKMAVAQRYMRQLEEAFGEDYPLVVVPGGENDNEFSLDAWRLCVRLGGIDWKEDVLPAFPEWEVEDELTEEQEVYYRPGNVWAAYAVQNVNGFGRAEDWIVVGTIDGSGNKPGTVLQDRWICAPYSFNLDDANVRSSALGAAYVAKIAAEVKRRLPELSNAEIADLLFSTADDLGDPEVYGRGVINPVKLWEEVAAMEARKGNDEQNN